MAKRRLSGITACAVAVGVISAPVIATPAIAANVDMAIAVAKDGNGPFTREETPGGDTGENNGIVRTNDTITYTVSLSSNGGSSANERFTLTAPAGTTWVGLPSICSGAGSEIVGQDLTCNVGTLAEGNTLNVPVPLTVTSSMKNGDEISVTGSVTADDADNGSVTAASPVTTVSASARYDLQKNTDNSILTANVPGPGGVDGITIEYPMVIAWKPIVPGQGLLGYEQSAGTFTFTDDVSEMYGGEASPAVLYTEDGAAACGLNTSTHFPSLPAGYGGGPRGVMNTGVINCTQAAPGDPIQVSITGNDSSNPFAATQNANGGVIAGGSQAFVGVAYIRLWVPTPAPGSSFIAKNTYTPLQTTSISGGDNYPGETEPTANNSADRNLSSFAGIGGFKFLGQVRNADTAPVTVPGAAKDGEPFVTEGQVLRSHIGLLNLGTDRLVNAVSCDTFDNRTQRLRSVRGFGGYTATSTWEAGVRVQFAAYEFTTPAAAQKQTCGDADATWFDKPEDVPGGIDAVGMVRAIGNIAGGQRSNLFTFTEVKAAAQNTRSYDFGHVMGGDTSSGGWQHDSAPADVGAGPLADSVIITQNLARITKKIVDPGSTADDTPDRTSFVTAGDSIDYALYPTLTNSTHSESPTTLVVKDVLPFNTSYAPESASVTPTSVEPYTDNQGRERTQLTWEFDNVTANDVLDPITYTVNVSGLAQAGAVENYARIESPSDVSDLKWRDASRSVRIVTAAGVGVSKTAAAPVVVNGDELTWSLDYTNTDTSEVDGVDLIDVLPANGDRNGSKFSGTATLASAVTVDAAAGESVLYTTAEPGSISLDPNDSSNQTGGSTKWCTEDTFDGADCPESLADVTAVRIVRANPVAGGAIVSHTITMQTTGSHDHDTYVNRFGLRASNLALPVQSNPAEVTVVSGTIGDYVWEDTNENGLQDSDEPALSGVAVALTGTDDLGAAVSESTSSDDEGAYQFSGLRPGTYTVAFTAPSGRTFTVQHAGDDSAVDSDVNTAGVSVTIELAAELTDEGNLEGVASNTGVDAGVLPESVDPGAGAGAGADGSANGTPEPGANADGSDASSSDAATSADGGAGASTANGSVAAAGAGSGSDAGTGSSSGADSTANATPGKGQGRLENTGGQSAFGAGIAGAVLLAAGVALIAFRKRRRSAATAEEAAL